MQGVAPDVDEAIAANPDNAGAHALRGRDAAAQAEAVDGNYLGKWQRFDALEQSVHSADLFFCLLD